MREKIEHCIELYRGARYFQNSEDNIDVDGNNVQEQTKKGRTLLLCSCQNHTKFCNEGALCRHKIFFIMLPFLKELETKIKDMEIFYRGAIELNKEIKPGIVLEELKDLRRMEWMQQ